MANNVSVSAGVGTAIATDDIADVHYQVIKLAAGAEESTARIGGDAANGLDVDITRLPALVAGTATIGAVRPAPATSLTATQVTVGTASTQIVASNATRRLAIIQVVSGGPVYIRSGTATVDDFPLATGGVYEHSNTAALSGIVASGSADLRILEEL